MKTGEETFDSCSAPVPVRKTLGKRAINKGCRSVRCISWVWGVCERELKCVKCVCCTFVSVRRFGMNDGLATRFGNKAKKISTSQAHVNTKD